MSRAAWLAAAAAGLLAVAGVALVAFANDSDDEDPAKPAGPVAVALDEAEPATKPFSGLTQATVQVGDQTLDVVLADESEERHEGLRERGDIGRYDGMLFVFDRSTFTAFTMSTVPVALDIGFYDEQGEVVDRLRMEPCPEPESGCPTYSPSGPFTYALETLADRLPRGPLGAPS